MRTSWPPVIAGLICVYVAIHEISYWSNHPHAHGTAPELVLLAVAGVLVAFGLSQLAGRDEERRRRERDGY